jgi:hypothetical protein
MDPFTVAAMALSAAQGAMSIFGLGQQNRQQKRVMRMQQAQLRQNADLEMMQSTVEQNKVDDQLDDIYGAQTDFFAGGNLDPTSGSPAILQAMTAAQGETDKMMIAARGQTNRANMFQQILDLETGISDARKAHAFGVGTQLLNTASTWAGIAGKAPKGAFGFNGFGGGMPGASIGGGNTLAAARRLGGFSQGWGV